MLPQHHHVRYQVPDRDNDDGMLDPQGRSDDRHRQKWSPESGNPFDQERESNGGKNQEQFRTQRAHLSGSDDVLSTAAAM
jgi:hypothetical protein